jgi:hypothetical protein
MGAAMGPPEVHVIRAQHNAQAVIAGADLDLLLSPSPLKQALQAWIGIG